MYKIVGADRKEYGPVTAEQIIQWIKEGRANGQTIARFEEGPWKPLSTFPEFAEVLGPAAPAAPAGPPPLSASAPPLAASPPPASSNFGAGPRNNGMAIAGLTCSLLGIVCCGPIFATLGLIFSCIGLVQVNRNRQQYSGTGLAWAGIIIALVDYILFAVLIKTTDIFERILKNLPH
ncbi:MAG: DUF4190 domain-containing protein [Verrucomicrobia bacterium]|nr:DUF4190 domain-containing protein [Verrucomicrobiota bacterium]